MSTYRYIGKDISGQTVKGLLRASNPDSLANKLAEQNIVLQSYFPTSSGLSATFHGRMKRSEITRLTRQMAVLISSEISVLDALDSIIEQIDDKKLLSVFGSIRLSIESGISFHEAYRQYPAYFDTLYVSLLETGEISGTLGKSLLQIASYREKTEAISKKIKAALAYPALVLLVSAGVIYALVAYIIPIFSSMYAGFDSELPTLTKHVVLASEFLRDTAWIWIVILIILLPLGSLLTRTKKYKYLAGYIILRIPVIKSLALKLAVSRFCRTLGALLTSDLQLITAISVSSQTVGNYFIMQRLEPVVNHLAQGEALADVLKAKKIFPKTVIRMITAGESTGRLGEMLTKTADFYESELDNEISAVTSVIEPIIILILGVVVAFILIAMYLPLFDLIGQIGP